MIEQISAFFTVEMIYMWLNIGVIPFWLILIIFPQTKVCGLFVTSIIPTFILASVYVYLLYRHRQAARFPARYRQSARPDRRRGSGPAP